MFKMFDLKGRWYKGNLHMHTTESDGRLQSEAAVKEYRDAGYDFISITDHWVQSSEIKEEGFLMLPGIELDSGDAVNSPVYHIVGVGMDREITLRPDPERCPQELIDAITGAGGLAILAHPAWSVTDPESVMRLRDVCGVEIFNTGCDVQFGDCARADSSLYFDMWAAKGRLFRAMAADDSHWYIGEQARSYIMVNSVSLDPDAIMKAILEGNFYASQGPEFVQITRNGDKIELECSKAKTAVFYSNCPWADEEGNRVKDVTEGSASYKIGRCDRYVRIELIDENNNYAWSSPIEV